MTTQLNPSASLPAGYAREIVDLCGRFRVSAGEVLRGLDLTVAMLEEPRARVPLDTFLQLVQRAETLTGEPGLCYYAGLHTRVSWHGFLGFAAMTASTLGEALELAERYSRTRTEAIALVTRIDGDVVSVFLEENVPLGPLREFLATTLFIGLALIGESLVGKPIGGRLDLSHPEPAYFQKFKTAVPALKNVRFDQPANRAVFPRDALSMRIVSADPAATKLAREQCERELSALGESATVLGKVRVVLRDDPTLSLEEVAKLLRVSARTLKRRLAEEKTTFSDLSDGARKHKALVLLEDRRLTIDAIATAVGYSDTANFTRAFKRWTGKAPGEARDRAGA
ncbi:MAG: AraC family transcriptional regulator [Polyangiaceae bacterium]|nr:AraC family transcriptional regulator [Polyangiaceae bacterium]